MAKKNEKSQKQQENKQDEQPTTPVKPEELTDAELGQVVGGGIVMPWGPSARPDGIIIYG